MAETVLLQVTFVPVTALYTGILALIYVGLAVHVIHGRWATRIGLGTGGNDDLLTRTRIHGNFAEYVPFCLLVLLLLELSGTTALWLHAAGVLLVFGRLAHAYGLKQSQGASAARAIGVVATFSVLVAGGAWLLLVGAGF